MFKFFDGENVQDVNNLFFEKSGKILVNNEYLIEEEQLLKKVVQEDNNNIKHVFYEGDIVEAKLYSSFRGVDDLPNFVIPVVVKNIESTLSEYISGGPEVVDEYGDFEVLGNIFENKELFYKMEDIHLNNLQERFPSMHIEKPQKLKKEVLAKKSLDIGDETFAEDLERVKVKSRKRTRLK